jgi:hypothetical protein
LWIGAKLHSSRKSAPVRKGHTPPQSRKKGSALKGRTIPASEKINPPKTHRRPGSPHSKKLAPFPAADPCKSAPDPPESTLRVPNRAQLYPRGRSARLEGTHHHSPREKSTPWRGHTTTVRERSARLGGAYHHRPRKKSALKGAPSQPAKKSTPLNPTDGRPARNRRPQTHRRSVSQKSKGPNPQTASQPEKINPPKTHRRPGSPHSKKLAPFPAADPCKSAPIHSKVLLASQIGRSFTPAEDRPDWKGHTTTFRGEEALEGRTIPASEKINPPKTHRRPGSPHSKKLAPVPAAHPCKSAPDPPESTPRVPNRAQLQIGHS